MQRLLASLTAARQATANTLKSPATAGLWRMVIEKYSDEAHYIVELLQNADDAGATSVRITLAKDHLSLFHNGTEQFTITPVETEHIAMGHLNALTAISASTKDETNKIGKFGIGFKSVFAATDSPHIEDDNISVNIIDHIVPVPSVRSAERRNGETLISLPFINPEKDYAQAKEKLNSLKGCLLFLNNLRRVDWTTNDSNGYYEIETSEPINGNRSLYLTTERTNNTHTTFITATTVSPHGRICAMLPTTEYTGANTFCFFPIIEDNGSRMLMHAPFRLNDSREHIIRGDEHNSNLIKSLGELTPLFAINANIISAHINNALSPIEIASALCTDHTKYLTNKAKAEVAYTSAPDSHKYIKSIFHPLYRWAKIAQTEMRTIPTQNGMRTAKEVIIAKEKGLEDIFSGNEASALLRTETDKHWLCTERRSKSTNITEGIRSFTDMLTKECGARTIGLCDLLGRITTDLATRKGIEWSERIYALLAKNEKLCKDETLYAPFTPTEGGTFYPLYDKRTSTPLLCIADSASPEPNSIHTRIASNSAYRRLLTETFRIPVASAESLTTEIIAMRIANGTVRPEDEKEIGRLLSAMAREYKDCGFNFARRKEIVRIATQTKMIPSRRADGSHSLMLPKDMTLETADSLALNNGAPHERMLRRDFIENNIAPEDRQAVYELLSAAGLNFYILATEHTIKVRKDKAEEYGIADILETTNATQAEIIEKEIFGLEALLRRPTKKKSIALCRILDKELQSTSTRELDAKLCRQIKLKTEERTDSGKAMQSLIRGKWLLTDNNQWTSPKECASASHLADIYNEISDQLFLYLGIDPARKQYSISASLATRLHALGLDETELESIAERLEKGEEVTLRRRL